MLYHPFPNYLKRQIINNILWLINTIINLNIENTETSGVHRTIKISKAVLILLIR